MVPWNSHKAKVQLRLASQRLRLLQEKKLALAKQSRREIADLLTKQRVETARLRVETLIGDDIHVELLEIVELYTETLLARFALLDASKDAPDQSLMDAVTAIIYAAPHTELKELHVLREMLMHKFGREFALKVINNDPPCVPSRVLNKLAIYVPPADLVDMYLQEIAKGYGIEWTSDRVPVTQDIGSGDETTVEGSSADKTEESDGQAKSKDEVEGKTDVDAATAPAVETKRSEEQQLIDSTSQSIAKETHTEDAFSALAARFDALKKR